MRALDQADLALQRGSFTALVGESGSGKSTLARCLAHLEEPSGGELWWEGRNYLEMNAAELRALHAHVQLIFQDPASALNPRFTARQIIEEPLLIQKRGTARKRREVALSVMDQVGLLPAWAERQPLELSGGQRQRLAIARALALAPSLLILDEALSGLDLSTQAQILNLLLALREKHHLTYLLISHDLSLASQLAQEILVMHAGRIVERGAAQQVLSQPVHPHTLSLIAAMPQMPIGLGG